MNITEIRIMLVDDDAEDREFFAEAIRSLVRDVSLEILKSGKELLEFLTIAEHKIPVLIFIDFRMPDIDGLETTK